MCLYLSIPSTVMFVYSLRSNRLRMESHGYPQSCSGGSRDNRCCTDKDTFQVQQRENNATCCGGHGSQPAVRPCAAPFLHRRVAHSRSFLSFPSFGFPTLPVSYCCCHHAARLFTFRHCRSSGVLIVVFQFDSPFLRCFVPSICAHNANLLAPASWHFVGRFDNHHSCSFRSSGLSNDPLRSDASASMHPNSAFVQSIGCGSIANKARGTGPSSWLTSTTRNDTSVFSTGPAAIREDRQHDHCIHIRPDDRFVGLTTTRPNSRLSCPSGWQHQLPAIRILLY